jgi:hypothetical protein
MEVYICFYILFSCLYKFHYTWTDDGLLRLKHVATYHVINKQLC